MCACLFVCPIITHELLNRFASNIDWGTWENHGNVLSLVLRLQGNKAKMVIFDQARVNGEINYEYPGSGQRWVLKLSCSMYMLVWQLKHHFRDEHTQFSVIYGKDVLVYFSIKENDNFSEAPTYKSLRRRGISLLAPPPSIRPSLQYKTSMFGLNKP